MHLTDFDYSVVCYSTVRGTMQQTTHIFKHDWPNPTKNTYISPPLFMFKVSSNPESSLTQKSLGRWSVVPNFPLSRSQVRNLIQVPKLNCVLTCIEYLLPPESVVSSTSQASFSASPRNGPSPENQGLVAAKPCAFHTLSSKATLFLASITPLSMYVQQRNVQKLMFRLGCPTKVKQGIETIVPIKDQQQTPTPQFFWTFALHCRPSISFPIKQAPSKCRTAG